MSESKVNYGLIGSVTAKAVAVGPHSTATVNETGTLSREEFEGALDTLHAQIAALQVADSSRQLLYDDVAKIRQMGSERTEQKSASDALKGLVDKLKMVGVFMQAAIGLAEPIKKVAEWFAIPMPS